MVRQRAPSGGSENSSVVEQNQELSSMYDYLAKIILLGPSGSGKSCLLHRFVKDEWRVLSSQTIGVEFASKIIKVGTGARRKRIKLQVGPVLRSLPARLYGDEADFPRPASQLWDTAGTERFRSVSRSYYRGAAGAILVYDLAAHSSFAALPTFLNDARALASPDLTLLLVGNKADLTSTDPLQAPPPPLIDVPAPSTSPTSSSTTPSSLPTTTSTAAKAAPTLSTQASATTAPLGREVLQVTATRWASTNNIPVTMEVSALTGAQVSDVFVRLAAMILTKIELGEVDPDDPQSGIQYGDSGIGPSSEAGSIKSGVLGEDGARRRRKRGRGGSAWMGGMREWEEVFRLDGGTGRRRAGCC
ncbi:MAG: hypothetical protein M1838_000278 [Thelocarpon superellum]|nr:MAG: hypothetical protein M1838_000278 [Thelocarpon superellum]